MRILCVLTEKLYPGAAFISGYGQHARMAEFLDFYFSEETMLDVLHFWLLVAMEGW